ncbi:hypothetical protein [Teredinibacter turnerae]|uniref:hypothetical protein n=1 Tax=Teredinibacter turnerae TaxID=2426 RepID=UPI0003721990|nr:hypothetical protein [Teredinibacter turnerae]
MDQTAAEKAVINKLNKLEQTGFEKLWAITAPTDPDVIRVMNSGNAKYYKVNTEIDGGSLLRAIKHRANQGMNNLLMRGACNFKRLLTSGVTS